MKQRSDPHKQVMARLRGFGCDTGWSKARGKAWMIGSRFFARVRPGDRGQSLVETALVIPMLLGLVMAVFSIGMGMTVYEQLGEAAFAGDQAMSQNANAAAGTDLCYQGYLAVTAVLKAPAWSTANLSNITYSATLATPPPGAVTTTVGPTTGSFSCASDLSALGDKGQVTLTLSYPYKWLPILGQNMGTITITRQQSVLAQ